MFETKGDRPQWRTVYEKLSTMKIGEVITYPQLQALLPDASEQSVRMAFYRAMQECETEIQRTFTNVRLVGYQMVPAAEHERLARGHHKRAKGQLKRAHRKATSADRSMLTREERARIDAVELNLARQMEVTARLEAQTLRLEEGLRIARREQRAGSAAIDERLDRVEDLLARHGITDRERAA